MDDGDVFEADGLARGDEKFFEAGDGCEIKAVDVGMAGIEAEESVIPKLKPFFEPALPVAKSIPRPCQPPRPMPQRPHERRHVAAACWRKGEGYVN